MIDLLGPTGVLVLVTVVGFSTFLTCILLLTFLKQQHEAYVWAALAATRWKTLYQEEREKAGKMVEEVRALRRAPNESKRSYHFVGVDDGD